MLASARSVVDAEPTLIELPAEKGVPLMVPSEPVKRFVPTEDVATSLLLASRPRSEEAASEVKYTVEVAVNCEVEALEKRLVPVHQLLLARSVEEAAVTVNDPPAVMAVELTVARVPVRSEVPIDDDATTWPEALVERSTFAMPARVSVPAALKDDVAEPPK